jgi:hypothetical protein
MTETYILDFYRDYLMIEVCQQLSFSCSVKSLMRRSAKHVTLTCPQRSHAIRLSKKVQVRNIQVLRDELRKLRQLNVMQFNVAQRLAHILSPSTYRDASNSRASLFKVEFDLLKRAAKFPELRNKQFDSLLEECEINVDLLWEIRELILGNDS